MSLHLMGKSVEEASDIGLEVCVGAQQTGVGRKKTEANAHSGRRTGSVKIASHPACLDCQIYEREY